MKAIRSRLFRFCPRVGKVMSAPVRIEWKAVLFPLVGLASLIWFLVRVVPKPSRASYPCQRVAAPLASSFVLWLLAVSTSALAFRRARNRFQTTHIMAGILCLVAGVVGIAFGASTQSEKALAAYPPHPPNQPLGVARGLFPGRVVWVYDPEVTDWPGPNTGTRWYEHVEQAVADRMLSNALRAYTGANADLAAWSSLFQGFNAGAGYTPGERITIKINLVTVNARMDLADAAYNPVEAGGATLDSVANAPQLLHALLDQLVNGVGVAQADITIGDPTGLFVNYLYDPLRADFPEVHYWDNRGTLGRTRAEFGTVPFYWSTPDAAGTTQDYLPMAFEEADYLINFAVLKAHDAAGITLNAKNHYGSLLRCPDGFLRDVPNTGSPLNGYYDMHYTLSGDGASSDPNVTSMGRYRALVDLMGHEGIGGKTLLYLIDGLFGGQNWYAAPSRWSMPPFNNDWPSSLFLSMDPVAIDSVARDFLSQQWPEEVLMYEGVEDYLHEAALADNPPSGTFYDPEGDGIPLASLGVHEHWNNADVKQYSRNLGIGDGIELIRYSVPTAVTLASFTAAPTSSDIVLKWETAVEFDNLGFNLYRAESPSGPLTQLNSSLIPAQMPGSPMGAVYEFVDGDVVPTVTYYYWLEALAVDGTGTTHGPVGAQTPLLSRLLPARPRLAPQPPSLRGR